MIKQCAYMDRNCDDRCMAYDIIDNEGNEEIVCRRLAAESYTAMNLGDIVSIIMPRECECDDCNAEKEVNDEAGKKTADIYKMFG
jgi:hypothetical protein